MIDLLLDALAAYRLTKLVTDDTITAVPRAKIIESAYRSQARAEGVTLSTRIDTACRGRLSDMRPSDWDDLAISEAEDAPKLATLITCRWCAGFYCSLFVVAARRFAPRAWPVAARALALSAGSALIAGLEQ